MRALPLCLLLLAGAASAGPLYKWKDANGVTQYSERPPVGQKYETRQISQTGVPLAATTEAAAPESQECLAARKNLELLAGSGPVMRDTDGDGKADQTLDDSQRAAQRTLAEAAAAAYCKPADKK